MENYTSRNRVRVWLSLAVAWLLPFLVQAQEKPLLQFSTTETNYVVYGQVQDLVTRQALVGVKSQILTPDSVLLFEWITNDINAISGLTRIYMLLIPSAGEYVMRFSKEGYKTTSVPLKIDKLRKRESTMLQKPILLQRLPRERTLKEATVRATKVKFYTRGDTIVYNADAFQLEEGSMLDALIRQLPGAELKDDGRILVNGKQVESLLLNGEDFFKKDRTVMLENLPTYMVQHVKVYDKSGQTSQLLGKDIGDKQLVMDVRLKKQYEIGRIGNVEAAGGSHDRYLARLFGLRFTAHSRLSAFAGLNNLNDRQRPGVGSEWTPSITDGLRTTRYGGLDYLVSDRRERFKVEGDATVSHTDARNEERTSSQAYLQQGDTYGRSRNRSYGHGFSASTNHNWTFNFDRMNLSMQPYFSYSKTRGDKSYLSANTGAGLLSEQDLEALFAPDASPSLLADIINRTSDQSKSDGHDLATGIQMQAAIKLPHTMDKVLVEAGGHYTENSQRNYARKFYDYPGVAPADSLRNEYGRNGLHNYSVRAKVPYASWAPGHNWRLMPSYQNATDRTSQRNSLYRLDSLSREPDEWPSLGQLPSVTGWMERTFDPAHSVFATARNYYHVVALKMHKGEFQNNRWTFDFNLPLSFDRKELDYNRPALVDTAVTKRFVFFRPSLSARHVWYAKIKDGYAHHVHELNLGYNMGMEPPALSYYVDVRTDDNPLNVYEGNSHLRTTHSHNWQAAYQWRNSTKQRLFSASFNYQLVQNAVAMGYVYDRQTGVYTFRPENVNGNNTASGQLGYSTPLDRAKRLTLNLRTNASHVHSIDLSSEEADVPLRKSAVNTTYVTQGVDLNYAVGHVRIGGKFSASYTHQTSQRANFDTTDAVDFRYGLTLVAELGRGWQVSTDATMYSRRGYGDSGMNTDDLVWNMRVAKKLMKGKLSLMVDGFDLLNNLSNIRRNLNTQGYTETWYMSIPRYVMFHVVYRLNRAPRQKQ